MLTKKMRIGLVSPFPPEKDGIAIYSDNILRGLGKGKREIVCIGRKGSKVDYIVNFRSLFLKEELEKIIIKEKLDLVHIQYVPTLFGKYNLNYSLIRALSIPIPTIVTLHEVHYSTSGLRNKVLAHIEKEIIERADKAIVHTPKQKEFLEKKYKSNNIVMMYHGMRLNSIPKRKNKKNILCFGIISSGKGVPYLIRAMKYLPGYNLTIAGGFVDENVKRDVHLAIKNSKSKIETDFKWIDEEKKEEYYKNANIVVLPHTWAPYQSGILHNSVAWGLPVVVTRVGALYEMVDLFKFGEVVRSKDPKSLAEGIRNVFKECKRYKVGINKYRNVANWKKIATEHLSLYKEIKK
ncbi:MAG: glycosyltransferase [Nanoarchaeota archaeon]|nr:glycosyltransferase [Nanoarchaeota archaeon]